MVGQHISIISSEHNREQMDAFNARLKEIGEVKLASKHRRKNGSLYDVSIYLRWHPDLEIFTGFTRDITAKVNGIAALKASERKFRGIITGAIYGYWQLDGQGLIRDINDSACEMTGYTHEELIGRHISIISANRTVEQIDAYNETAKKRYGSRRKHCTGEKTEACSPPCCACNTFQTSTGAYS